MFFQFCYYMCCTAVYVFQGWGAREGIYYSFNINTPLPISKVIAVNWSAVRALDSIDKSLMTCDDMVLLHILR